MKLLMMAGATLLSVSGAANAQGYYRGPPPRPAYAAPVYGAGCPAGYHQDAQVCICDQQAVFYTGGGYGGYSGAAGGYGGGYGGGNGYPGGGYDIHVSAPGVRVSGPPVMVASGQVYVQGAPIYVQAPPVRVASPQIYLQRPQVVVQPSEVTVEPPTVHIAGCAEGTECEAVGTSAYRSGSH